MILDTFGVCVRSILHLHYSTSIQTVYSDDTILEARSTHTLRSEGPRVDILLEWHRFSCFQVSRAAREPISPFPTFVYTCHLSLCSVGGTCLGKSFRQSSWRPLRNISRTSKYEYSYTDEFPLFFWSTYTLDVRVECLKNNRTWTVRKIHTGPGGEFTHSSSRSESSTNSVGRVQKTYLPHVIRLSHRQNLYLFE